MREKRNATTESGSDLSALPHLTQFKRSLVRGGWLSFHAVLDSDFPQNQRKQFMASIPEKPLFDFQRQNFPVTSTFNQRSGTRKRFSTENFINDVILSAYGL